MSGRLFSLQPYIRILVVFGEFHEKQSLFFATTAQFLAPVQLVKMTRLRYAIAFLASLRTCSSLACAHSPSTHTVGSVNTRSLFSFPIYPGVQSLHCWRRLFHAPAGPNLFKLKCKIIYHDMWRIGFRESMQNKESFRTQKLVATASRCEGVFNWTGRLSVTFFSKGGAKERPDISL